MIHFEILPIYIQMKNPKNLFLMLFLFSVGLPAQEIIFDTNIKYKKNDTNEYVELKAQQPLSLQAGERILVSAHSGIPLLILAPAQASSKIQITQSQLSMAALDQVSPYLERTTSDIIDGVRRVDNLISKRDYSQALSTVNALKEKYRGLSTLLFLSGTANYLNNNKSAALKDLEEGLSISPDNSSAKKLLEKIKKEL